MFQISTFHSLHHFWIRLETHFSKTQTLFLYWISPDIDKPILACTCIFHQNSGKWLLFELKHMYSLFEMKISTCAFVHQIWEFRIKTSFLHVKFTVSYTWLAFQFWHLTCLDFDETQYSSQKHLKIHFLSFRSLQTLSKFKLSSSDYSPIPTLMDDDDSNVYKMISTHLDSNILDVLDSMSQEKIMRKTHF